MTLSREQRSRRPIYTQTINKLNSNRGGTHRTEQVKGVVVVRGVLIRFQFYGPDRCKHSSVTPGRQRLRGAAVYRTV